MSGTLALASAIAEMDRSELRALVLARLAQAPASVQDPIGLATELLRAESIQRAIARLDSDELLALTEPQAAGSDRASLRGLGLVGLAEGSEVALPEVVAAITEGLERAGRDVASLRARRGPLPGRSIARDPGTWYDTALTAVGQCAECLRAALAQPVRLNRSGAIAVAGARVVAEATGIEPERVPEAFSALGAAGLTVKIPNQQLLVPSATAQEWLDAGRVERWVALARGLIQRLPGPVMAALQETSARGAAGEPGFDLRIAVELLPTRFPLLPEEELAAAAELEDEAETLGITVDGMLAEPGRLLLESREPEALAAAERDMPGLAPGVYVQPDLSVIVPGPLAPADEAALSALTSPEHIGIASTLRVTEAAVAEAFERGISLDEARATFERLSLTGIPQPLEYLLSNLAERVGSIVVSEHHSEAGRTRIAVSRPALAQTLLVDRALQHLQLRLAPELDDAIYTRLRPDHVLAALADARYHASAALSSALSSANAAGSGAGSGSGSGSRAGSPAGAAGGIDAAVADTAPVAADTIPLTSLGGGREPRRRTAAQIEALEQLADRVHTAARSEPGTGDFTRRIELAIRERRPILVTAEAAGQTREFTLLPLSVTAGRLRASDQAAGVERTLPIGMITAVETA